MDFRIAFWFVAELALISVLDCFTLEPHAGSEVSGHQAA